MQMGSLLVAGLGFCSAGKANRALKKYGTKQAGYK
jgi:hypothetical protein